MTKILVIDDDPMIVHMVQESLREEGFSVMAGYDGRAAVDLAQSWTPHLVIMDVQMPATDGLQALRLIRGTKSTRDLPIIFLTGAPPAMIFPAVSSTYRVTYLKKPVDFEELLSTVRHFLYHYPRVAA